MESAQRDALLVVAGCPLGWRRAAKKWSRECCYAGVAAAAVFLSVTTALAGPVLVYREGSFCPRDRAPDSPRITAAQAIERAKALLPSDFCGPNWFVDGCEFDPEQAFDTWRVYAHQYKRIGGRHDTSGRQHSYVVLDAIGNCLANIPGT